MEVVVDAYGPEEQAMGWYYYLQDTMQFPFTATCITRLMKRPSRRSLIGTIGLIRAVSLGKSEPILKAVFI